MKEMEEVISVSTNWQESDKCVSDKIEKMSILLFNAIDLQDRLTNIVVQLNARVRELERKV